MLLLIYAKQVVVCSSLVHASDYTSHRIQVYRYDGLFVTSMGGGGQIQHPTGEGLDGKGNLFVADTANNRIQIFWCPRARCGEGLEPRGLGP